MLGLLHKGVATDGPTGTRDRLRALYRASSERCLRQTAQLLRLLDELGSVGVVAMPIKGPTWAERLYGDVTLRHWVDLDLVVPFAQVTATRALLRAAGYRDWYTFDARLLQRRKRTAGELHFWAADGQSIVDVHWQVGVGYSAETLRAEDLMARAVPQTLLGRSVPGPTAQDMLLMMCMHGTRHQWDSVEMLLAVAVQVRDLPAEAWPALLAAAREAGCARRVVVAVAHTCRVLGLPRPAEVEHAIARDAASRALLRSLGPESLLTKRRVGRQQRVAKLVWTVATEDSLRAAFEHAALRVLRPGPGDWQSVALPGSVNWLYWVIRPARLLLKWARRWSPGDVGEQDRP